MKVLGDSVLDPTGANPLNLDSADPQIAIVGWISGLIPGLGATQLSQTDMPIARKLPLALGLLSGYFATTNAHQSLETTGMLKRNGSAVLAALTGWAIGKNIRKSYERGFQAEFEMVKPGTYNSHELFAKGREKYRDAVARELAARIALREGREPPVDISACKDLIKQHNALNAL